MERMLTALIGMLLLVPSLFAQQLPSDTVQVDEPPVVLKQVPTRYPAAALSSRAEGVVWLKVLVNEQGRPAAAEVIRSPREDLSEAAKAAALQFEFKPALRDGKPIAVWVSIPFKFSLKEAEARLAPPSGGPTPEEIASALRALGISVESLRYTLGFDHRIAFTMDVYLTGGKLQSHTITLGATGGKENALMLVTRNEGGKLISGISMGGASGSFPPVNLLGMKVFLSTTLADLRLVADKKMPLFVFVADSGDVRTLKQGTAEAYIKKYRLVVVFSARLKVQ